MPSPNDYVVCDREKDYYTWWYDRTEYFTCYGDEHCCGNAWDRHCCDGAAVRTGMIIGMTVSLCLITLTLVCLFNACYHYKKQTKQYHNVVHWYEASLSRGKPPSPPKQKPQMMAQTISSVSGQLPIPPTAPQHGQEYYTNRVEMPNPATLYASTDINSMAAPFVPGPALYVEPTLNQQLASPYQPRKAVGPFY